MGSWNDIGWFKDEELTKKYDEVSAELYQVMNESIIAAVNENKKEGITRCIVHTLRDTHHTPDDDNTFAKGEL